MTNLDKPIEVNGSTLPTIAATVLRYLIATLGTYAVAKGWVNAENIDGIATLAVTAATVLYGIWRTGRKQKELVVVADAAPNSVARVV